MSIEWPSGWLETRYIAKRKRNNAHLDPETRAAIKIQALYRGYYCRTVMCIGVRREYNQMCKSLNKRMAQMGISFDAGVMSYTYDDIVCAPTFNIKYEVNKRDIGAIETKYQEPISFTTPSPLVTSDIQTPAEQPNIAPVHEIQPPQEIQIQQHTPPAQPLCVHHQLPEICRHCAVELQIQEARLVLVQRIQSLMRSNNKPVENN